MKRHLWQFLHLISKLLKYLLLILVAGFIFLIIIVAVTYQDLKQTAANGLAGKNYLEIAVAAAKNQNWEEALTNSRSAQTKFSEALTSLNRIRTKPITQKMTLSQIPLNDLEYLLKTAEILSRSLERSALLAGKLKEIQSGSLNQNFNDWSANDKIKLLKLIYESEPELNGLKANLDLAILNLAKIHRLGILWPLYQEISDVKNELQQTANLMARIIPLTKLLPILSGYPNASHFLLILQNNDELRPSGGFIGVYGILESQNGQLSALKTDDSYHVDMPAVGVWKLEPPSPIKKYLKVENWYFRDANWSPDWPTAAQKIEEIYTGEMKAANRETKPFTGIMAINPDLVADLLSLVGPITVRGEKYQADNLQPLLQYNVEVAYKEQNISSWDRKEVINELLNELKKRLFSLESNRWSELLKIIDRNIATKNIQIYLTAKNSEDLITNLGAGGELKSAPSDYLLVVDANLAAFKSDAVVKKQLNYQVKQNGQNLQAQLQLTYRHEGGFDWRTTRYRSYTRVYTPLGSKLNSLQGIPEETADLNVFDDPTLNKTIFGFFISLEPGTNQQVTLNYNLPVSLLKSPYSLLVQKQSGRRTEFLRLNLDINKQKLNTQTDLETDKYFPL